MGSDTLILGLGNPIACDDAVGLVVAGMLGERLGPEVDVVEAAIAGIAMLDLVRGYRRLVVIDSVACEGCREPGRLRHLRMEDLGPAEPIVSHHGAGLPSTFEAGRLMGYELPEQVEIWAIEIERPTEFGESLSDELRGSLDRITRTILEESFDLL
jgi:hydrogenase maturation protease